MFTYCRKLYVSRAEPTISDMIIWRVLFIWPRMNELKKHSSSKLNIKHKWNMKRKKERKSVTAIHTKITTKVAYLKLKCKIEIENSNGGSSAFIHVLRFDQHTTGAYHICIFI